jgi:hypothetical protein
VSNVDGTDFSIVASDDRTLVAVGQKRNKISAKGTLQALTAPLR